MHSAQVSKGKGGRGQKSGISAAASELGIDRSALQRDEHLDEWRRLTLEKVRQSAAPTGGKQPKENGYRKTAKEFGTDERDIRRAEKVASLTPEAKEVAREVHLDDNRSALLKAAVQPEPKPELQEGDHPQFLSPRARGAKRKPPAAGTGG